MSKQIDLIGENLSRQLKNHSNIDQHRPAKLNLSNQPVANPKWSECKVLGKNILIRSYGAACVDNNDLYVYGGLQILNGILSDFHKIDLSATATKYEWVEVPLKDQSVTPGPRAKHAMVCYNHKIYLIAGIKSAVQSTNQIYCYDINEKKWKQIVPKGEPVPAIDSFGYALIGSHVILTCGYNGTTGHFINTVYDYDIETNTFSTLFSDTEGKPKAPIPRANCSAASDGVQTVYIFGGNQDNLRFNDLWSFDIKAKTYTLIDDNEESKPVIRSGHTLTFYEDRLYLFGGIHEVTWELDDLHIYNIKNKQWTTLEIDSARRKDNHLMSQSKVLDHKNGENSPSRKKVDNYWYQTNTSIGQHKGSSPQHHANHQKNPSMHFKEDLEVSGGSISPGKMIEEQKKKEFMHKKAEMLKEFEVPEKQKGRYISVEPTTQAMRNSLDIIGNPITGSKHPGKLTEFGKQSCSKFLQPLANNVNLIVGRKPCARDGHNTVVMGPALVIFGGDRHQMSFNDIFKLDMNLVTKQFTQ